MGHLPPETSYNLLESPAMPHGWVKVEPEQPSATQTLRVYEPKKALPKGHWTFTLELRTSKSLGPRNEVEEYIQTVRADIIAEQGRPSSIVKEIGHIELEIIQIRRIRKAGMSLSEICGEHSLHVLHMYDALYDAYAGWRVPNSDQFDIGSGSIYLIHTVRLDRDWRGNGIGLLAIEGLLRSCFEPDHEIAVLRPRALEEAECPCPKVAMQKLSNHWAMLGFETCATRSNDEDVVEDMYMSVTSIDESLLRQIVPHLFPRRRRYARKDTVWKDDLGLGWKGE